MSQGGFMNHKYRRNERSMSVLREAPRNNLPNGMVCGRLFAGASRTQYAKTITHPIKSLTVHASQINNTINTKLFRRQSGPRNSR